MRDVDPRHAHGNCCTWQHNGKMYDAVYSEDDDGYYLQRHSDGATSDVQRNANALWNKLVFGHLEWEPR